MIRSLPPQALATPPFVALPWTPTPQSPPQDQHIALAVKCIADPDATVREAAARAMATDLRDQLVPLLVRQLDDEYHPLYLAARKALVSATTESARKAAIEAAGQLLDNASPRRQEDGSYILGQYRSDYRLDRQIQLLNVEGEKTDFVLVSQVLDSLGRIGRPEPRAAIVGIVKAMSQLNLRPGGADAVASALVAAGRLGFAEVLPTAGGLVAADPLKTHEGEKAAGSFAIGMLAKPTDPVTNTLFSALNNPIDGNKKESVKAVGNLKIPGAVAKIQEFPNGDEPSHPLAG